MMKCAGDMCLLYNDGLCAYSKVIIVPDYQCPYPGRFGKGIPVNAGYRPTNDTTNPILPVEQRRNEMSRTVFYDSEGNEILDTESFNDTKETDDKIKFPEAKTCVCGTEPNMHSNGANTCTHVVHCPKCGRKTQFYGTFREAIEAWNMNDLIIDPNKKPDMVNQPPHYTQGGVECIDAIRAAVTGKPPYEAWLTGQIIKYVWRYNFKNGKEDLEKAEFYLKKLIEEVKE